MDNSLSVNKIEDIFSERFRIARKDSGYSTQAKFIKKYDEIYGNNNGKSISATVKKWERAAVCPSIPTLLNVCEMLNCSLDYLLGRQNTQNNDNIKANERTGFDDIALNNIVQLKEDKEKLNIVSGNCTAYNVLYSLVSTETGIRLLTEIAYRITRKHQYPKCKMIRTSDYAGIGEWLIPIEDLRRSDDMQLFNNLLNWINNHDNDIAQIYQSDISDL